MFTRHGTERVIRFAFDLARRAQSKAPADLRDQVERTGIQTTHVTGDERVERGSVARLGRADDLGVCRFIAPTRDDLTRPARAIQRRDHRAPVLNGHSHVDRHHAGAHPVAGAPERCRATGCAVAASTDDSRPAWPCDCSVGSARARPPRPGGSVRRGQHRRRQCPPAPRAERRAWRPCSQGHHPAQKRLVVRGQPCANAIEPGELIGSQRQVALTLQQQVERAWRRLVRRKRLRRGAAGADAR